MKTVTGEELPQTQGIFGPAQNRKELALPESITPEEAEKLKGETAEVVAKIKAILKEPDLVLQLSNFGRAEQQAVASTIDLLDTPMREVLVNFQKGAGKQKTVPESLTAYRQQMEVLNPNLLEKKWWARALLYIPVVGHRILGRLVESHLRKLYFESQTVRQNINAVIAILLGNRDSLLNTIAGLSRLYKDVDKANASVAKKAYQGELLLTAVKEIQKEVAGTPEEALWNEVGATIAARVQNMRVGEQSNLQSLEGIITTVKNNTILSNAIQDMVDIGEPMLKTGMGLRVALSTTQKAVEAYQATGEFLGNMLESNAELVLQQTTTINEIRKNPVVALSKVQSAYNKLMEAAERAQRSAVETQAAAESGIEQLKEMSQKMGDRIKTDRASVGTSNALFH